MKQILLLFFIAILHPVWAQVPNGGNSDDLLDGIDSLEAEEVIATFKSTRVVNAQSVQTVGRNVLDFRIMHRFGTLNTGLYQLFGLDNATMRMGFEYGVTSDFMIGIGRSTVRKTYDGFLKYKILKQTTGGKKNMPVTLTAFVSSTYNTFKYNTARDDYFNGKLDYVSEILIGRKFNEAVSLQIMPIWIHRNLTEVKEQKNNLMGLGIGGRYKFSRSMAVNFDYYYVPQNQLGIKDGKALYLNPLSIGIDLETGGHVFQLHFTNSIGLVEKQFIGETTGNWLKGDILFGFNMSRVFTLRH